MRENLHNALSLMAGILLLGASAADAMPLANVIDLRAEGSSETTGSANGALFFQLTSPPTGTGNYDPFLRLQDSPIEEAFNTDYRLNGQAPLDAKSDPNYTHSMTLGSLLSIEVNGQEYYSFTLDLDEPDSDDKRDISLDEVKLYLAGAPDLGSLDSATPMWSMDGLGDAVVYLDGSLSPGNGADDMQMLVPTSFFVGADPNQYLYFYTKLGSFAGLQADGSAGIDADGSLEEWRALLAETPTTTVPEPATVLLLGGGLAAMLCTRRRRGK